MQNYKSKLLLAARAIAAKDWSAPSVIMAARHMANEGCSLDEIQNALGWNDLHIGTVRARLNKWRIRPFSKFCHAKRGQRTSLSNAISGINQTSYRAKMAR